MFGLNKKLNCVSANSRWIILIISVIITVIDQLSKYAVIKYLPLQEDKILIDGFFKLVYWGNTGAAWSLFKDNNEILTVISLIALFLLFLIQDKFETKKFEGKIAMGLIYGGIIGNIADRIVRGHVVDFLYFYIIQRSGKELGFPAFNIADLSICIGVGLMFLLILNKQDEPKMKIDSHKNHSNSVYNKEDKDLNNGSDATSKVNKAIVDLTQKNER